MSRRLVLCGDIGGTKTLLAVAALDGDRVEVVFERRYADRDFAEFADLVRAFATKRRRASSARASASRVRSTGAAWPSRTSPGRSTPTRSRRVLGVPVALANDFVGGRARHRRFSGRRTSRRSKPASRNRARRSS